MQNEQKQRAAKAAPGPTPITVRAPQREGPRQIATDERPGTADLEALQRMADQSPQVARLTAMQRMAVDGAAPVPHADLEDDELQMIQRQPLEEEEQLQGKALQRVGEAAPRGNNTGLPDNLKAGIESLSGLSMDHVKVHRNSDKPAAVQAHAYAQGSDIHLGPGDERYLPHEAWHVIQQMQGRVRPTIQAKGVAINDDPSLERESDLMGSKASLPTSGGDPTTGLVSHSGYKSAAIGSPVMQRDVAVATNGVGAINAVAVNRWNMVLMFGAKQGDHTTAFTVFGAMFRNRLMGLTLPAAVVELVNIYHDILALPGMVHLANSPNQADVVNQQAQVLAAGAAAVAADGGVTFVQVNAFASELLSFRNIVPLTALAFGGVGHGEGFWQGQMQLLENELAVGWPFNLGRQQRLARFAKRLIDRRAFADLNTGALDALDQDIAPGIVAAPLGAAPGSPAALAAIDENQRRMAHQHLLSVVMAYPATRAAWIASPAAVKLAIFNYLRIRL